MSVRYFQTPAGVVRYGGLTEDGLQVLLDAGHEEITAEQYQAEEAGQAEAAAALIQRGAQPESNEPGEEAVPSGGNKRQRRR
jgi:hypothetical protein